MTNCKILKMWKNIFCQPQVLFVVQTLVEIVIFSVFSAKKQEISSKFLQKTFFFKFAPKRWSTVLFPEKMLKMTISTSGWSAQHPNAGQNIQHLFGPLIQ